MATGSTGAPFNLPFPQGGDVANVDDDIEDLARAIARELDRFVGSGANPGGADPTVDAVAAAIKAVKGTTNWDTALAANANLTWLKQQVDALLARPVATNNAATGPATTDLAIPTAAGGAQKTTDFLFKTVSGGGVSLVSGLCQVTTAGIYMVSLLLDLSNPAANNAVTVRGQVIIQTCPPNSTTRSNYEVLQMGLAPNSQSNLELTTAMTLSAGSRIGGAAGVSGSASLGTPLVLKNALLRVVGPL